MAATEWHRFDITHYWTDGHEGRQVAHDPADRYTFTAEKYVLKQCEGSLLSVVPVSSEFEYLEGTCNALLRAIAVNCTGEWERWLECDVMVLEVRVGTGQDRDTVVQSLYAIEVHLRVGHLDSLCDEEEQEWPVDIRLTGGVTTPFCEHWIRLKRGKKLGKVFAKRYHTRFRNSNFDPEMCRERFYERGSTDLESEIPLEQWKAVFDMPKWTSRLFKAPPRSGGQRTMPDAPATVQLEGDFMLKESSVRMLSDECKYYLPVPKADNVYDEVTNFVFTKCVNVLQWTDKGVPHSAAEMLIDTMVNGDQRTFQITLDTKCQNNSAALDACIKNQSSYLMSARKLPIELLGDLINPLIMDCEANHARTTAVTLLGLQVRHIKELRNDECKPPVFLYENCVFTISQGYESIQTLEEAGYRLVPKVYQDVTKSMLGNGGFPRLTLVDDIDNRKGILEMYIRLTVDFHSNNAPAALWAQGLVWASLAFLEWIEVDKCFPIAYLMSSLHGNGKSTTMYALANSIGLPQEAIGGNKTSESGFLDWVNSCNGLAYFLDDFNAKAANLSRDQHTFKELFKSLHDANSVCQHDKFRLVLSASVVSSNTQLAPWDAPTQSRLMTFIFENAPKCALAVTKNYNNLMKMISCLVPDIMAWRYDGKLDIDCINELQTYIQELMEPLSLQPRCAQHLKKPMYYICLALAYVGAPTFAFDTYIFKYLLVQLKFYYHHCTQTDMWNKFFKFLSKTMSNCNRKGSDGRTFIHWYIYCHVHLL